MSGSDNDPFEGTTWARDPHRGTVWSSKPFEGTVWEDRTTGRPETIKKGEGNSKRGGSSIDRRTSPAKRGPLCILIAVLWMFCLIYGQSAAAETINGVMAGVDWEATRHFWLALLGMFVKVFAPISFIMVAVIAFIATGRGFLGFLGLMFKGAMGVAVGGLVIFFGTFLYLIIIGVIGK